MPTLFKPAPLPEFKGIDTFKPLQAYYMGKQQQRQQEMQDQQMQVQQMQMQMEQQKLQDYQQNAPMRQESANLEMIQKRIQTDTVIKSYGEEFLSSLDPDSPTFEKDLEYGKNVFGHLLVERGIITDQDTAMDYAEQVSKNITPEYIAKRRIEMGIDEAPAEPDYQINTETGQYVDKNNPMGGAGNIPGWTQAEKDEAATNIGKLIKERDKLPPDDPNREVYDNAIKKASTVSGLTVETDADGNTRVTQGPIKLSPGMGTSATNANQKGMQDASNALVRLNDIEKTITKSATEYLSAAGKARFVALNLMEKAGKTLSPEDQKYYNEATEFVSTSLKHLNKTLNELSGAAVSVAEFERITQAMPNPGKEGPTNILTGDSKSQFLVKLKKGIELQRMAIARYNYINKNGLEIGRNKDGKFVGAIDENGKFIGLDDMPALMNKRANEIGNSLMTEYRSNNINIKPEEIREKVKQQVAQEFGLTVL